MKVSTLNVDIRLHWLSVCFNRELFLITDILFSSPVGPPEQTWQLNVVPVAESISGDVLLRITDVTRFDVWNHKCAEYMQVNIRCLVIRTHNQIITRVGPT